MTIRWSFDDHPTKTRHRFTAPKNTEAVEFCMQEDLSCSAVAHRHGLLSSSLACRLRQSWIDRSKPGPNNQGLPSSEERTELNWLRKENRKLSREKDFSTGGGALGVTLGLPRAGRGAVAERLCLIEQLTD
jgi:transposase-like protein